VLVQRPDVVQDILRRLNVQPQIQFDLSETIQPVMVVADSKEEAITDLVAASTALVAAVALEFGQLQLLNPAASEFDLFIQEANAQAGSGGFELRLEDPATALATAITTETFTDTRVAPPLGTPTGTVLVNTSLAPPGTIIEVRRSPGANIQTDFRSASHIVLRPGAAAVITLDVVNVTIQGNFVWRERRR